jgi:hypothetical protein
MQPLHSPCTRVLTPQLKAKAVVNAKIRANAVTSHNGRGREATGVEASAYDGNWVITAWRTARRSPAR